MTISPPMVQPKLVISVVDDEQAVRKALRRLLGAAGFDVRTFASGREFLNSLEKQLPDCVILDLGLPEMSGLEIQREVGRRSLEVPLIIITGRDDPGLGERVRAAGAAAYLQKPLDERVLLEAILSATHHAGQDPNPRKQELPAAMPAPVPLTDGGPL